MVSLLLQACRIAEYHSNFTITSWLEVIIKEEGKSTDSNILETMTADMPEWGHTAFSGAQLNETERMKNISKPEQREKVDQRLQIENDVPNV